MKNSIFILLAFFIGLLAGYCNLFPVYVTGTNPEKYALYLLIFLVGIAIGADRRSLSLISRKGFRLLLVPMATITGTFAGILMVSGFISDISLRDALAVGAGFGYYSLSSIIISQIHCETLGVVALLANLMREIITLSLAPLMVAWFGKLAPITAAGATSMDTTLPVITTASGKEYAVVALFHGILLTILVPVLVTLILTV